MLLVNSTAINALQSQTVEPTMKISGDALTNMKEVERDATCNDKMKRSGAYTMTN